MSLSMKSKLKQVTDTVKKILFDQTAYWAKLYFIYSHDMKNLST